MEMKTSPYFFIIYFEVFNISSYICFVKTEKTILITRPRTILIPITENIRSLFQTNLMTNIIRIWKVLSDFNNENSQ